MKVIRMYRTHTEITPYAHGECKKLESLLTAWHEPVWMSDPLGYRIRNNTLYLPRGIEPNYLENALKSTPLIETTYDPYDFMPRKHEALCDPRDNVQKDSIDFLCGRGAFKRSASYAQISLNAGTGDGKTYCTTYFITHNRMKAIVITHRSTIEEQWVDTMTKKFDYRKDEIREITGSSQILKILNANDPPGESIFFVSHRTLATFANRYSPEKLHDFFIKLRVGVKVYDEAHLEFRNILMVDMFSNTFKTIYLTATLDRSDHSESEVFKRAFNNVMKFKPDIDRYAERRRHIVYCPVLYSSDCPEYQEMSMKTSFGFNSKRFIDYALADERRCLVKVLNQVLTRCTGQEGRIMVIAPKIDSCEYLKEEIEDMGFDKAIGTIHSKNSNDDNDEAKNNADIIISTMASMGTGADVKGLRFLINLEPFASTVLLEQLKGRLRVYSDDLDSYFFDLVDISVKRVHDMYKTRLKHMKTVAKQVTVINIRPGTL